MSLGGAVNGQGKKLWGHKPALARIFGQKLIKNVSRAEQILE